MPHVRALAATDFYPAGTDRTVPALRVAMFEGQVYDVPESEAERLVAEGRAEVVAAAPPAVVDEEPAERPKRARKAAE